MDTLEVGTLSHDIHAAVEHSLLHTDTLGVLRRHNARQQVQCFDVTVIETRIFLCVEFDGHIGVVQVVLADGYPQLAGGDFRRRHGCGSRHRA